MRETRTPFLDDLRARLGRIDDHFECEFVKRSRVLHDIARMDGLIASTKNLLATIEQFPARTRGPELNALEHGIRARLAVFSKERAQIDAFVKSTADERAFFDKQAGAILVFARFWRHCAGQQTATRDLGLLTELLGIANRRHS